MGERRGDRMGERKGDRSEEDRAEVANSRKGHYARPGSQQGRAVGPKGGRARLRGEQRPADSGDGDTAIKLSISNNVNIIRSRREADISSPEHSKEEKATNGTLTVDNSEETVFNIINRERREAVELPSTEQHFEAANGTVTFNNKHVVTLNNERVRRQAETMDIDGVAVLIPAGAMVEQPITVEIVASEEELLPLEQRRVSREATMDDLCMNVQFDGLYMLRMLPCDEFVECMDHQKRPLADGAIMKCSQGLMFMRNSLSVKNDKAYMDGECVDYEEELCKAMLA